MIYSGLGNNQQASDTLKDVDSIHISATFRDVGGERSFTELYLQVYYSPTDHFIKVSTSTTDARVSLSSSFNYDAPVSICFQKNILVVIFYTFFHRLESTSCSTFIVISKWKCSIMF